MKLILAALIAAAPAAAFPALAAQPAQAADDRQLILETSRRLAQAYVEFAHLPLAERRSAIEKALSPLNVA